MNTQPETEDRITVQRHITVPASFPGEVAAALEALETFEAQAHQLAEHIGRTLTVHYKVATALATGDEAVERIGEHLGWTELYERLVSLAGAFTAAADDPLSDFPPKWGSQVTREAGLRIIEAHDGDLDAVPDYVIRDLASTEIGRLASIEERLELLASPEAQRSLIEGLLAERASN